MKYFSLAFLAILFCLGCGNDDNGDATPNCDKGNITASLNGEPWLYDNFQVDYAQSNNNGIFQRALGFNLSKNNGTSVAVLFTSLALASDEPCLVTKVYFESVNNSFCVNGKCDGVVADYLNGSTIPITTDQQNGTGSASITECDFGNRSISGTFNLIVYLGGNSTGESSTIQGSFQNLCF